MIDINNNRKKTNLTQVFLKSNTRWWAPSKRSGTGSLDAAQPIIFNDGDLDLTAWITWAIEEGVISPSSATITAISTTTLTATTVNASAVNTTELTTSAITYDNYQTVSTATYNVGNSDFIIYADASSNAVAITLPSAVGAAGRIYKILATDSTTNAVTIDASAGNINGAATLVYSANYENYEFHSDGANWFAF